VCKYYVNGTEHPSLRYGVIPHMCLEDDLSQQTPPPRRRSVSLDPRLELTWMEGYSFVSWWRVWVPFAPGAEFPYLLSARRMYRHGIRPGPGWPSPKFFEYRRGGKVSSVVPMDNAFAAKSQSLTFLRGGG